MILAEVAADNAAAISQICMCTFSGYGVFRPAFPRRLVIFHRVLPTHNALRQSKCKGISTLTHAHAHSSGRLFGLTASRKFSQAPRFSLFPAFPEGCASPGLGGGHVAGAKVRAAFVELLRKIAQ